MNYEKNIDAAFPVDRPMFSPLPRKRPTFRLVDNQATRKKVFNARRSRSRYINTVNNVRSPSLLSSFSGRKKPLSRNLSQVSLEQKVSLVKIIGITELSNRSFTLNHETGAIAYPAGASIVSYDAVKREQTFLTNRCRKAITCLAFSPDGKYMASGEKGHNPKVRIWDLMDCKEIVDFAGHRYSIDCVCFSPNLRFVVSVGVIHDMSINVWNWKIKMRVSTNNICSQITGVAFYEDGSSFVTVGNRHVKFWYLSATVSSQTTALRGRSGILAEKKNNNFCDVACGKGDIAGKTFVITTSSLLCEFSEDRLLEKWVDLKTEKATCLSVGELYIMVGCGYGVVRVFNTDMQYMINMPVPFAIGTTPKNQMIAYENKIPIQYADVVGLALDEERSKVFIAYNDHSWYHWDISDIVDVKQVDHSLSHGSIIWSLTTMPSNDKNKSSDVLFSCSSDCSCRTWKIHEDCNLPRNQDLSNIFFLDDDTSLACDNAENVSDNRNDSTIYNSSLSLSQQNIHPAAKCIAIDHAGVHLAIGDCLGNVRIFQILNMQQIYFLEAHDSDVLCLQYSNLEKTMFPRILASSGRDRFIHMFDRDKSYMLLYSIDDHSAAISTVIISKDALLFSSGADKTIIVRSMQMDENTELKIYRQHQIVERHSIMDMVIEENRAIIISACQDKLIRIYSMSDGKRMRSFRGTMSEEGSIINIAIDNTGTLIACSCSDKSVYLWNLNTTECLATLMGHSEFVTSIQFANNSSYMYTAGADSCIFIWKLSIYLLNSLRRRFKTKTESGMKPVDNRFSSGNLPKPDLINSTSMENRKPLSANGNTRRRTQWSIDNPNTVISCSPAVLNKRNTMPSVDSKYSNRLERNLNSTITIDSNILADEKQEDSSIFLSTTFPVHISKSNNGFDDKSCKVNDHNQFNEQTISDEDTDQFITNDVKSPELKKRHLCNSNRNDSDDATINETIDQAMKSMKQFCNLLHQKRGSQPHTAHLDRMETTFNNLLAMLWSMSPNTLSSSSVANPINQHPVTQICLCLEELKANPVIYNTATNMLTSIVTSLKSLLPENQQSRQ